MVKTMASGQQTERENETEVLIRKDTRVISTLKYIVIACLFLAGIALSTMTLVYSRRQEEGRFAEEFEEDAQRMIECFTRRMARRLWLASSLSISLTSYAQAMSASWPYVSLPDFELRAFAAMHITNSSTVAFSPLIKNETRSAWESYASRQMKAMDEQEQRRGVVTTRGGLFNKERRSLFRYNDDREMVIETNDGPYSPIWQVTTRCEKEAPILYNQFANPVLANALNYLINTKRPILADVILAKDSDCEPTCTGEEDENAGNCVPVFAGGVPRQIFMAPIFDTVQDKREVVGSVSVYSSIANDFRKILRNGHPGVTVVLANNCGQTFSFKVKERGTFKGEGNIHEGSFSKMVVKSSPEMMHDYAVAGIPDYEFQVTGVKQNMKSDAVWELGKCDVSLMIYPTQALHDTYITPQPEIQAFCVALAFAFASLIFIIYDMVVERRQSRVMDTAHKSKAIVQSLFPAVVREKMLKEQQARSSQEQNLKSRNVADLPSMGSGRMARRNSMNLLVRSASMNSSKTTPRTDGTITPPTPSDVSTSAPIAELFPNTTVLFADIAGFTAWSSQREPHQVFQLLETLYR